MVVMGIYVVGAELLSPVQDVYSSSVGTFRTFSRHRYEGRLKEPLIPWHTPDSLPRACHGLSMR